MNYYEILGASIFDSAEVIRSKFLDLLKLYDPETHDPAEEAVAMRAKLHEAYSVLGDPELRKKYNLFLMGKQDAQRTNTTPPSSRGGPSYPFAPRSTRSRGILTWGWFIVIFSALSVLGPRLVSLSIGHGLNTFFVGAILAVAGTSAYAWLWGKMRTYPALRYSVGAGTLLAIAMAALMIRSTGEILHPAPTHTALQTVDWAQYRPLPPASAPPKTAAEREASWNVATAVWEQNHADFMADPVRRDTMNSVLDELERSSPGLPDDELLRRAQELAFSRTGWAGQ